MSIQELGVQNSYVFSPVVGPVGHLDVYASQVNARNVFGGFIKASESLEADEINVPDHISCGGLTQTNLIQTRELFTANTKLTYYTGTGITLTPAQTVSGVVIVQSGSASGNITMPNTAALDAYFLNASAIGIDILAQSCFYLDVISSETTNTIILDTVLSYVYIPKPAAANAPLQQRYYFSKSAAPNGSWYCWNNSITV